ncbi:MAG TPA: RNA polymerase sigma factor [Polyangiaceae bacterium]|nr:RNA polymerase sigma factor [Polyangiaceae bacterium]
MASATTLDPSPHVVPDVPATASPAPPFEVVYEAEFAFVWRNLRRLGVPEAGLRDATQDVFLVVLRRLPEFEGRAPLRSWLYSIVARVARQHRRTRKRRDLGVTEDAYQVVDRESFSPQHRAEDREALRLLLELLDRLDDEKREAFILSDLEGMTAPEIAQALGVNLNTVYSRVRAARLELRAALAARAADGRKLP